MYFVAMKFNNKIISRQFVKRNFIGISRTSSTVLKPCFRTVFFLNFFQLILNFDVK